MKTVKVEILTQITTTYREVIEVELEDDALNLDAVDKGYEYYENGLLQGGEEVGVDGHLYDVRVCD